MTLEKKSPCKINLLLNILGRRPDGFHEIETVLQPVPLCDDLALTRTASGIMLTCSEASLPADSSNLVYRAAEKFFRLAGVSGGVRIHLEKRIPLAAGLGGGSGNAATTLLGLNELFDQPLGAGQLQEAGAALGSDVPFFLQKNPALGTGRGEKIESFNPFPALAGATLVLVHPGFGIPTPWAYQQLGKFPEALNGRKGRAKELMAILGKTDIAAAGRAFYNSLEAPALKKYPLLVLFQEFFREQGAAATLMSGSGSSTFALWGSRSAAERALERFKGKFGGNFWTAAVGI